MRDHSVRLLQAASHVACVRFNNKPRHGQFRAFFRLVLSLSSSLTSGFLALFAAPRSRLFPP